MLLISATSACQVSTQPAFSPLLSIHTPSHPVISEDILQPSSPFTLVMFKSYCLSCAAILVLLPRVARNSLVPQTYLSQKLSRRRHIFLICCPVLLLAITTILGSSWSRVCFNSPYS
ncbi:hypothetical protein HD806DRAFT_391913 [Xylariaceae sp. AK1471]|nr:hypothetical protein HD806DRAFT_391913 [Xylariaceae sp. AK1471]